jgi:hypothetical protein
VYCTSKPLTRLYSTAYERKKTNADFGCDEKNIRDNHPEGLHKKQLVDFTIQRLTREKKMLFDRCTRR